MKSYCKGLVITRDIVASAYERWLGGEAGRKNAWRVDAEHGDAGALVDEIAGEIRSRSLATSPARYRTHVEPSNGKVRKIAIESVKQQVLDYVFHDCIEPLLDAKIGFYQTASIEGRGQVWAKRHIERWVPHCRYFVKTDISKCYPSTSHEVCMKVLRKYVRSDDVLYIAEYILSTYEPGLNIGSRFSLDMMNLILSFAYHHVEGLRKARRGKGRKLVKHQIWFMDDCLMLGNDKRDLKAAARSMARYVRDEFGLTVKPWKVCKLPERPEKGRERVKMCGFYIEPGKTTVADTTFVKARRAFSRMPKAPTLKAARRCCSYYGWLKHSDSHTFMKKNGVWKALRMARQLISEHDRRLLCTATQGA